MAKHTIGDWVTAGAILIAPYQHYAKKIPSSFALGLDLIGKN
jgi:hypothetical protein